MVNLLQNSYNQNYIIDKKKYFKYINNNEKLANCQKKTLLNYYNLKYDFYKLTNSNILISSYYTDAYTNKNINEISRLQFILAKFSNFELSYSILELLKKKRDIVKDIDIINIILKIKHSRKIFDKYQICNKWNYALEYLSVIYSNIAVKEVLNNTQIKYLDIGCGDGNKTKIFSNYLKLKKDNIYCTDIKSWGPYQKNKELLPFHFKYIENDKLNFDDNSFDIVSVILTLHHVKNLEAFLKEIHRIIKVGGYLLLIEHSVYNDHDRIFINIEHLLYTALFDKRINYVKNPDYINCFNMHEWNFIMKSNKLIYKNGGSLPFKNEFENNYDNIFYGFYKKK